MKKSYHNKLKTILYLARTDITKKNSYNATLNFWQNQTHVQYSMFCCVEKVPVLARCTIVFKCFSYDVLMGTYTKSSSYHK